MIAAGLQLMVLGMTIVFVFLILLVMLMSIMSNLVRKFEPVTVSGTNNVPPAGAVPSGSADGSYDTHIPAILAAVVAHRKRIGAADTQ